MKEGRVIGGVNLADCDILPRRHLIPHKILENDANLTIKVFEIVFSKVHAIEQNLPFNWIVQACHKLDNRGFTLAVLPDQGDAFGRAQLKIQVFKDQAGSPGITERHVAKLEATPDRPGCG